MMRSALLLALLLPAVTGQSWSHSATMTTNASSTQSALVWFDAVACLEDGGLRVYSGLPDAVVATAWPLSGNLAPAALLTRLGGDGALYRSTQGELCLLQGLPDAPLATATGLTVPAGEFHGINANTAVWADHQGQRFHVLRVNGGVAQLVSLLPPAPLMPGVNQRKMWTRGDDDALFGLSPGPDGAWDSGDECIIEVSGLLGALSSVQMQTLALPGSLRSQEWAVNEAGVALFSEGSSPTLPQENLTAVQRKNGTLIFRTGGIPKRGLVMPGQDPTSWVSPAQGNSFVVTQPDEACVPGISFFVLNGANRPEEAFLPRDSGYPWRCWDQGGPLMVRDDLVAVFGWAGALTLTDIAATPHRTAAFQLPCSSTYAEIIWSVGEHVLVAWTPDGATGLTTGVTLISHPFTLPAVSHHILDVPHVPTWGPAGSSSPTRFEHGPGRISWLNLPDPAQGPPFSQGTLTVLTLPSASPIRVPDYGTGGPFPTWLYVTPQEPMLGDSLTITAVNPNPAPGLSMVFLATERLAVPISPQPLGLGYSSPPLVIDPTALILLPLTGSPVATLQIDTSGLPVALRGREFYLQGVHHDGNDFVLSQAFLITLG